MSIRRRIALLIYPGLQTEISDANQMARDVVSDFKAHIQRFSKGYARANNPVMILDHPEALVQLMEQMAAHEGVTHFAISMRALGKGDFFKNLMKPNGDCRTRTASRLFQWFSDHWPEDLEWPEGIPRTPKSDKQKEVA